MLTQAEINLRLHKFNETGDWSVFDDVPPEQQISVMYPHVMIFKHPDEPLEDHKLRHKQALNQLFGPMK